jgi:superfamily II DNA helicase RecQ
MSTLLVLQVSLDETVPEREVEDAIQRVLEQRYPMSRVVVDDHECPVFWEP